MSRGLYHRGLGLMVLEMASIDRFNAGKFAFPLLEAAFC